MEEKEEGSCIAQWLSKVQASSSPSIHSSSGNSPNSPSPCSLRKRRATSPTPPAYHSSSSFNFNEPYFKRYRFLPAPLGEHHQQRPALVESQTLPQPLEDRHIEGLEQIRMADSSLHPQTPKTGGAKSSGQSSRKSITSNVKNNRDALTQQNMWFDEDDYDNYEDLKTLVDSILGSKSELDLRTQSAKKIQTFLHDHATDNEDTLIEPLVDMVVKTIGYAPKQCEDVDEMLTESIDYLLTQATGGDLTKDGLGRVRNTPLRKGFVPNQTSPERIADPKPDFTWGLVVPTKQEAGQGLAVVESEVENWIKICPGLQHAFFASQLKGASKPIEEAENQIIPTGAVLVNARRHINAKATAAKVASQAGGPTSQSCLTTNNVAAAHDQSTSTPCRADLDSIAFTIAWVPQMAKLLVHWYEERPGRLGIYHATVVGAYMFAKRTTLKDSLLELRRDIGRILEWGIYNRKSQVEKVLREIYPNY